MTLQQDNKLIKSRQVIKSPKLPKNWPVVAGIIGASAMIGIAVFWPEPPKYATRHKVLHSHTDTTQSPSETTPTFSGALNPPGTMPPLGSASDLNPTTTIPQTTTPGEALNPPGTMPPLGSASDLNPTTTIPQTTAPAGTLTAPNTMSMRRRDYSTSSKTSAPSSDYSTPSNTSLPSSDYSTSSNTSAPSSDYSTSSNTSAPSSDYSTSSNTSLPSSDYSTPSNTSAPSRDYTAPNNTVVVSRDYTASDTMPMHSREYTDPSSRSAPSRDYTSPSRSGLSINYTNASRTAPSRNYTAPSTTIVPDSITASYRSSSTSSSTSSPDKLSTIVDTTTTPRKSFTTRGSTIAPYKLSSKAKPHVPTSIATNSSSTQKANYLEQAIDDANATAFGLLVAKREGKISPHTKTWRKAQDAISLLRRGKTRQEAARRADIPMSVLAQLIEWGQNRPSRVKPVERTLIATKSSSIQGANYLEQAIDDANAAAFGLGVAKREGQVKPYSTTWRKAQDAISLLRQGKTRNEAARRAKIPMSLLTQLIEWGQNRP